MASLNRLTALSNEIAGKTKIITDHLSSKGLGAASFDVDGLHSFPISSDDEEPFSARLDLIAATRELHALMLGPKEFLRFLAWDSIDQLSLKAIWVFKVAEAVPLTGDVSYDDVAKKSQELSGIYVPKLNLRRMIRHAITNYIFHEPRKGFIAHNRTSRLLLQDKLVNAWVGFICADMYTSVAQVVDAMIKWQGSEEPNETSVNLAFDQKLKWFDFIRQDPDISARYDKAMQAAASGEGFSLTHTVTGYPWGDLGEATVVDMGGNRGYVSMAIAEAYPKLSFIVQDTPGMITPEVVAAVPEHLKPRVNLVAHDFFTPQTFVAEAYLFRWIFHDFSDKYCVQILQALVPALKRGAKIIINDGLLADPGTVPWIEDRNMRRMDVTMQVTVNAREREVDDWAGLFSRADARFKFREAWKPPKSHMGLIVAEWDP